MQIKDLIAYLESIAPPHYQAGYDNSGLLVGDATRPITNVLIALDCIESIVDEAIARDCNLIVAHHPIIFSGLKQLVGANYIQRTVIKAIRHDIAIYAIHTNLDSLLVDGVNTEIANRIGLVDCSILQPAPEHDADLRVGFGMVGDLPSPMPALDFLTHLKDRMNLHTLKHTALCQPTISRVALCGGSGSSLLPLAIASGAQAYITSDFKYHEYFDADKHLTIADIGHYESEQYTIDLLHRLISEKFSTFAALKTAVNTNPVQYF